MTCLGSRRLWELRGKRGKRRSGSQLGWQNGTSSSPRRGGINVNKRNMVFAIGRRARYKNWTYHPTNDHRSSPTPPMAPKDKQVDHLLSATALVQAQFPQRSKWRALGLIALIASALSVLSRYVDYHSRPFSIVIKSSQPNTCPQSNALYPGQHAQLWETLGHDFDEDAFTTKAVEWLAGAVRIPYVLMNTLCDVSLCFMRTLCW